MSILNSTRQRLVSATIALLGVLTLTVTPAAAQQIENVDPNETIGAIDGDLIEQPGDQPIYADEQPRIDAAVEAANEVASDVDFGEKMAGATAESVDSNPVSSGPEAPAWADPVSTSDVTAETAAEASDTYKEDDLIGAAEGVFGKGAEGVAKMIQNLLADQGEPNGYIVGREAGGAFIIGARYGSGTLFHKVEGERPVYWTGPSIGLDVGANASNTFVLVYNLYDTEELYKRFPAGEGQAYLIGGLHASYVRRGDTVLIPIRVGAGLRLGVNAGYMKFSKKQRWLPF